jgi:protein-L-isoaspartate(D-aspartate) O-methyltransferase
MESVEAKRASYAAALASKADVSDSRVTRAFASVPREMFLGPGPWKVRGKSGYVDTPSDDPRLVYEDILVGLAPDKHINNGEPSLHARCLDAAEIKEGDRIVHVGCGSGYYTALLANLATAKGTVNAWDIECELVEAAKRNLAAWPHVQVEWRSGTEAPIPESDVIYVSAGCTDPPRVWIDSLADGGRLIFPLVGGAKGGGLIRVTRQGTKYAAKFLHRCWFIPCLGAWNEENEERLGNAFSRGDAAKIRSLRFTPPPGEESWFNGDDWWLSTT